MNKTNLCFGNSLAGRNLRKAKALLIFLIVVMLLGISTAFAADDGTGNSGNPGAQQQSVVTGKVTDSSTGESLPGVSVIVKGTTVGTATGIDGNFSISAPRNASLIFSFVGYTTQEVAVGSRTVVNVSLKLDVTDLDEVVVVGYGTQKRANVVGAVTSVDGDQLSLIPAVNVSNAISGMMPGITVIQKTGEPGQFTPRVLVRGRTTINTNDPMGGTRQQYRGETAPLIVIDGVPGRSMDEIDPNDIANFSVLKDASAAIYGSLGANGVILITTKKGQEGKPRLNYQFYQGFMNPTMVPEVCNAFEYASMLSEYQIATGRSRTYSDKDIELFKSGADPWGHPNTDWYGDLIKEWTSTSRHSFTLDGGARGMTYYVSLGLKSDDAFYKASSTKYKQYNLRTKLELPVNEWLKTGLEVAGFLNNRIYPYKSADAIVGQSTRLVPTTWSYWPTAERRPGPDIEYGDNPVETSTFAGGKDDQKTYRLLTTFNAVITVPFVKGLTFTGNYSFDLTNFYRKRFFKPWILYYPDKKNAKVDPATGYVIEYPLIPTLRGLSSPENHEDYSRTINQNLMFNANYVKTFGKHNIALLAGYEQYQSDWNNFYAFRKYYINDAIQTMDAGNSKDQNISGSASIYARKSWIGRASYDYEGKYLAEVVFRADGSLKFPTTKRWGYFPGVMLGWRASEEGFWRSSLPFINYFKLRASYGTIGMDPGSSFQFMNKYSPSSGMVFGTGSDISTAVGPPAVANPNITWETQTTYNVGFDSKILKDLFHLNAEFFYSKRKDILTPRDASVPAFTGLTLPSENIGIVDNRGVEIDAGVHKKINNDLRIDASFNFSYNHNVVVDVDEPARVKPWQEREGHPYGAWLMYDAIGIFKDQADVDATVAKVTNARPGDVKFRDVSGDGLITADDQILIDFADTPETFYGGTITGQWKDFSLTVQIQGQGKLYKRSQYDNRRGEAGNYYKWQFDDRWTPTNTETSIARAYNRDDLYWSPDVRMSTYWLENSAYCRLKNVVLNYNIPAKFVNKVGIARASINLSGNNLALIYSANKKWDPEADNPGVYPTMKTFAIGANITF